MRTLIVVGLVIIICLYYIYQTTVVDLNNFYPSESISSIARRDLSIIGVYNKRLTVTMKYWTYSMLVAAYDRGLSEEVYGAIKVWNVDNHDDGGLIEEGIELGRTQFLEEVDNARRNNEAVRFKVSSEYDYHDYPEYFKRNEYLYPDKLLEAVDNILGGEL